MTAVSRAGTPVISVGAVDSKLPWALTLATLKLVMRAHGNPGSGAGEGLVVGGKIVGPTDSGPRLEEMTGRGER